MPLEQIVNLTTISRLDEAVDRHYCESLFLADRLPAQGNVADVGSGAGFPGFVVAVARPGCVVTLVIRSNARRFFSGRLHASWRTLRVLAARAESLV